VLLEGDEKEKQGTYTSGKVVLKNRNTQSMRVILEAVRNKNALGTEEGKVESRTGLTPYSPREGKPRCL